MRKSNVLFKSFNGINRRLASNTTDLNFLNFRRGRKYSIFRKSRLLHIKMGYIHSQGKNFLQADGDADKLIGSIAINACHFSASSVAVIGTDTDLPAILIARGIPATSLHFP
ncbi:hypothetical protein AVEN_95790-1 [Araneus ventricosus]|uniref:NYN domain-containing protein n=1 Tax=Araneus ventricosus TaxID=182803 RepID=A0A4Y2REX2_ARAVE|nr:hypothetical protein AVEN_95790-1 [Araneus ventricosus]